MGLFNFARRLAHKWKYRNWPVITPEMQLEGVTWAKAADGTFFEVCDFCGGNCGQCGMTRRIGNVGFSMQRMADKLQGRL